MFRFKRIGSKITVAIISVGIFISVILGGIVSVEVSDKVTQEAVEKAEITVAKYTQNFDKDFMRIQTAVEMMGESIKSEIDVNAAKSDATYLATFTESFADNVKAVAVNLDYSRSVYIYFNSEVLGQASDIWFNKNENNIFERQAQFPLSYYDGDEQNNDKKWFYGPVRSKEAHWTAPYMSKAGYLISSYVLPVVKDGEVVALVGMDLALDDISTQLNGHILYDTGYLFMMDKDYNIIVHKSIDMGQNLEQLDAGAAETVKAMKEKTQGSAIIDTDGISKISGFDRLSNGWIIASSIPTKEITKTVDRLVLLVIVVAFISIAIAVFIAFIIGNSISKPIIKVTEAIKALKMGDFTVSVDVNTCDETKILADGLNDMINTVSSLIKNSKSVSIQMSESATNLASMAEETSATSDEVSRTIEEIAEGATNQAQEADAGNRKANELDQMFVSLIQDSNVMAENAENAMNVSRSGSEAISKLKEKSEVSKTSNQNVASAIKALDEKANSISSIVDTITSIAEQTNLLALNASIEAARAGEAGRGFSVVADEIRKLAESSSTAASQIQSIVLGIQSESRETVRTMDSLELINQEQNQSVDDVSQSIDHVFTSIENITTRIEKVAAQVTQINDFKNEITAAIANISSVSQQTAAATEEVTASMQQQNSAVEEVAKSAEQLTTLSIELTTQINKFKI